MKRILLTGPAGAGKTHALISQFRQALQEPGPLERKCVYVLPSAEHAERILALVLRDGLEGFFHRRITTLTRLVSELFGPGKQGVTTNVSKFLLIREILASQEWDYFKHVQSGTGFAHLMLGFISELKESMVGAETFRSRMNAVKGLEPAFRAKYEALAAIYERYEEGLKQRGLKDREDILLENILAARGRVPHTRPFGKIWIDGFYDFSALQFAGLEGLCSLTDEMTVTLTYDPVPGRTLFDAVLETRERLLEMGFEETRLKRTANANKAVILRTKDEESRDEILRGAQDDKGGKPADAARSKTLAVIESRLFASERKPEKPEAGPALEVLEAVEMEGEIEMIARRIDRALRTGDYRASDFAILLREVGEYQQVIRGIFRRYDLPVEIHERERLAFSPLIHTVVRLLKIFGEDWPAADLLAFLKSSYISRIGEFENPLEWVARLENYGLRERIGAGRERWLQPLTEEDQRVKGLLPGTFERLGHLAKLEDDLRGAADFYALKRVFLTALRKTFGLLDQGGGVDEASRRDAAALGRLLVLMDEIEMSLAGFAPPEGSPPGALFEAFSERFLRLVDLDLYSLHGGDRNCVQVYSVSLAREKEYRVVFVAGLLEKKFPREMREDPLLSDWERRLFNTDASTGLLRERLQRQNVERYLFYLAVTRASEKLVLSYPRMDLEGKDYLPSYYVEEVTGLFRDGDQVMHKQELSRPYARLEEAMTRREMELGALLEFKCSLSGTGPKKMDQSLTSAPGPKSVDQSLTSSFVAAAIRELCRDEQTRQRMEKAFFRVTNGITDPRILAQDAFHASVTSASRLEEYAKCSFRYYSHYVLKLTDPEEDRNLFARGLILHQALDALFKQSLKDPALLKNSAKALVFAKREMEQALREHALVFEKSYRYDLEVEGLWDMLKAFLQSELERLAGSAMVPRHFELGFGVTGGEHPALEIETAGQKIAIRGKIDRIDVSREGKEGLVLDYKRTASFKPADFILGVHLQLPIYLMAMERFLGLRPAGAELYSLKDIRRSGFYREELMGLAGKKRSSPMTFSEKDFQAVMERSLFFMRRYAEAMQAQTVSVKPRVCESYCAFSAVCRIEKWKLPAMLEEIREEDLKTVPPFPGGELAGVEDA